MVRTMHALEKRSVFLIACFLQCDQQDLYSQHIGIQINTKTHTHTHTHIYIYLREKDDVKTKFGGVFTYWASSDNNLEKFQF